MQGSKPNGDKATTIFDLLPGRRQVTIYPATVDTGTSVDKLCPVAREIARNLLDHVDDQRPHW